jgi:photoactive yellow protein
MIDFDTPHLAAEVEKLSRTEIDALPFGAIRLDRDNRVVFYSKAEAKLSGYGDRPSIGKIFFTDIAPCMANPEFTGRIAAARDAGKLDIAFGWVGDFSDRSRELQVRVQSASDGGIWLFLKRP